MIEHIVNFGLHKTINPTSVFTKYQLPVTQSILIISIAIRKKILVNRNTAKRGSKTKIELSILICHYQTTIYITQTHNLIW